MTTVDAIRNRINEIGIGEPFTSAQFNALGTRAAVDQSLARFVKTLGADYEKMIADGMFEGEPFSFDSIIARLKELAKQINVT